MIATSPKSVKAASRPLAVGVIFSANDLARALRLRNPPDLFELRLDGLLASLGKCEREFARLTRPLIITARSPREGGANNLSGAHRRGLLLRFLPIATIIDIELSSVAAFGSVMKAARSKKLPVILSRHAFMRMPKMGVLEKMAARAHSLGADIFKIVGRTDDEEQLRTLLGFLKSRSLPLPVSAMGVGKLGHASRRQLARAGSILNYAHLGRAMVEGQLSLAQLRTLMR